MTKKSAIPQQKFSQKANSLSIAASKALTELIDSLSREQIVNQELLLSLSFALRSFTNLHRFLELIPLLLARLVGVEGSLLIPFHDDGSLWRDQIQMNSLDDNQELYRKLSVFEEGMKSGFGMQEKNIVLLDSLVQKHFGSFKVFATSIVSRGRQRGRLYAFD